MAKRMTDTDKWKKPFLKSLPTEYKLFWLYLLDECDHAGIWHVEFELVEFRLGIKLSSQKIRGFFKERIVEFDNETKWFLPDFITFQYNELDDKNRAHKSVIDRLKKYNLLEKVKINKALTTPLQGCKDKDIDKDKDKEGGVGEILIPLSGWNCKPKKDEMLGEVPNHISEAVKIRVKSTKSISLTDEQISSMWAAFKAIKLDGVNFYASEQKVYDHFTNWIKDEPFGKAGEGQPAGPSKFNKRYIPPQDR